MLSKLAKRRPHRFGARGMTDTHICEFPRPEDHRPGDRWTCPNCGTAHRLTRPKPARWWRNWYAPAGRWVMTPGPGLLSF